jgi:hypothetical protein
MLETFLNLGSTEALTLNLQGILMVVLSSLALGLMISQVYIKTHRKEGYAENFPITLIMLPAIIAVIILLVGNNVARAFSLAGAFSLIRFRSAPGDPKDIAYVFFTLAVGLACGMGYLFYALIFALILCLVNEDAFENWLIKIKPSDLEELGELMNSEQYETFLSEEN